jgi:hypothetical protein
MAKHYAHCTITQDNCHKLVTGLQKSDRMLLDVAPSLTAGAAVPMKAHVRPRLVEPVRRSRVDAHNLRKAHSCRTGL